MDADLLSQHSSSTYCSEIERTGIERQIEEQCTNSTQSVSLKKSAYQQKDLFASHARLLEMQCQQFSQSYLQQSSPPLFQTQWEDCLRPGQELRQTMLTNAIHHKQMISKAVEESSYKKYSLTTNDDESIKNNYPFKIGRTKTSIPTNIGNSHNKIFETEDNLKVYSRKCLHRSDNHCDTISITSEAVSKIVDKEIGLHRKKKQERFKYRSQQESLPNYHRKMSCSCTYGDRNYPAKDFNVPISKLNRLRAMGPAYKSMSQHFNIINSVGIPKIKKRYKLTADHVTTIAGYFHIEPGKLTRAIENVLKGNQIDQNDSENEEINASQSPIKRRYSNSQFSNGSSASK